MAQSAESQSIKELTKTVSEQNAKRDAQLERIANSGTRFAERAQELIEADKEKLALQGRITGFSEERIRKADILERAIEKQKEIMEAQKTELEKLGINAEDNKKYQEEERQLARMQLQQAKATGSADAEDEAKKKLRDLRQNTFLGKIANGIGGILEGTKEKVKGGLSGFKKFAFGALAIAALAFLNSPKFEEIKNTILDVIIPAAAYLYDNVIKPIGQFLWEKVVTVFEDIRAVLDGKKGIFEALMNNKLVAAAIGTYLLVKLLPLFTGMLTAAKGIGTAVSFLSKAGVFAKIGAGFAVIKSFFLTSLLPFLTAAGSTLASVLIPIALIAAGLYGLKKGFDDFMFELEATGSIWEATKTAFVSFFANGLGIILDPIKDGISWVIGKIGSIFGIEAFKNTEKFLDSFSFVDMIADLMTTAGDYLAGLFGSMLDTIKNVGRKILGAVGLDSLSKSLFGTKEDDEAKKKAKEEEQKRFEEQRKALREKQKLEKEAEEAKKIEAAKKKEAALKVDQGAAVAKTGAISQRADPRQFGGGAPIAVNAPTNVNSSSTTSVTQNNRSLAPKDRVIDQIALAV